jgi:Protein of unknown function (DUF2442)
MAEPKLPDDFLQQLAAARRRGREADRWEPRATHAAYDAATGAVVIRMRTGVEVRVPAAAIRELDGATPEHLAGVSLTPRGDAVCWRELDVDIYVPGLLSQVLGLDEWFRRERAAEAGRARTEAKAASSRENGRRGGRPPASTGEPEPAGTPLVRVERAGGPMTVVAGREYLVDPASQATHRGRRVVALRYRGAKDGRVEARFSDTGRAALIEPELLLEAPAADYGRPSAPVLKVAEPRAKYGAPEE